MNIALIVLVLKLYKAIRAGDYFKAIEINERLTKVLDTYRNAC